jgi:hypothetical protein
MGISTVENHFLTLNSTDQNYNTGVNVISSILDTSTDPVLTAINIEPTSAEFTQDFNPEVTEYDVTFPFNVAVVKIWGKTSTCNSETRVNSRTGPSG